MFPKLMPIMQTHKSNSYENFTNLAIILKSSHVTSMDMRQELVARLIQAGGGCGRRDEEGWTMSPGPGFALSDHGQRRQRPPPALCLLAQTGVRTASEHR